MTRNIGGLLNYSLMKPAQPESDSGIPPSAAFKDMTEPEQRRAVRSLANDGFSDHEVARMFGLHVEMVRRVLATVDDEAAAAHARAWGRP